MIFTDSEKNIRIELIDRTNCKLTMISEDTKKLEGINRFLAWRVRNAPLDGGDQLNFSHKLPSDNSCILIHGDLIDAVQTLEGIECISEQLKINIIKQIGLTMTAQILKIMSAENQQDFAHQLREKLPPSPHISAPSSPKLFVK